MNGGHQTVITENIRSTNVVLRHVSTVEGGLMLALIDGDVLAYRVGYTTNNDPEWIARARLREMIKGILEGCGTNDYEIWLSDSKDNWRCGIFPLYKANRVAPKPTHLRYLQQLLVDEWDALVAEGEEADDALGIRQMQIESESNTGFDDSCICSIDKDLRQIPGNHYDFVKKEHVTITQPEGLYRFYKQILTGDTTDNIGVSVGLSAKGIGGVKADKLLEGCENENDLFEAAYEAFMKSWYPRDHKETEQAFLVTGQLIKIRTKIGEIWNFPSQPSPVEEAKQSSSEIPALLKSPSLVSTGTESANGSLSVGLDSENTLTKPEQPVST